MSELKIVPQSTDMVAVMESYFQPFREQAAEWMEKAKSIQVTDESQIENIEAAKLALKEGKALVKGVEAKHKDLKEESLRTGQALDKIKREMVSMLTPILDVLKESADFADVQAEKRKIVLRDDRTKLLAPYFGSETEHMQLGDMNQNVFESLLAGAKAAKKEKEHELMIQGRISKLTSIGFTWMDEMPNMVDQWNLYFHIDREKKKWTPGYSIIINDVLIDVRDIDSDSFDEVFDRVIGQIKTIKAEADRKHEAEQKALNEENAKLKKYSDRAQRLTSIGYRWNESTTGYYHETLKDGIFKEKLEKFSDAEFDDVYENKSKEVLAVNQARYDADLAEKSKLERERLKQEEKLKKERAERKRLEDEAAAKQAEEESAKKKKEAEERKAKRAPDKIKIIAAVAQIEAIQFLPVVSDEAKKVVEDAKGLLAKVIVFINTKAEGL